MLAIKIPAGSTVIVFDEKTDQAWFFKPVENFIEAEGLQSMQKPLSMVWQDDKWEYSFVDISNPIEI